MTSQGDKILTEDDALAYIKQVKEVFKDRIENYTYFLAIMKDYKEKRIHYDDLVVKVKDLFKEHKDLIIGFNIFAPSHNQISICQDEQLPNRIVEEVKPELNAQSPSTNEPFPIRIIGEYEHANEFVSKVKTRFEGNGLVYKSFLDIMNMLGEGGKSFNETYQEAVTLLEGHADLLDELIQFFPGTSRVAPST